MSVSATDFHELASRDYELCKLCELHFPDEFAVSGAQYHLQQAVEKELKALLLINGIEPPYVHDVRKLCDALSEVQELPEKLFQIAPALTLWEATVRYDPFISFRKEEYVTGKEVFETLKMQADKVLNCQKNKLDGVEPNTDEPLDTVTKGKNYKL